MKMQSMSSGSNPNVSSSGRSCESGAPLAASKRISLPSYYAKEAMGKTKPFNFPVRADITIYKKRHDVWSHNWGDVDNFVKAIFDALNGIVFVDDAQVVEICAAKKCGENGIIVEICAAE